MKIIFVSGSTSNGSATNSRCSRLLALSLVRDSNAIVDVLLLSRNSSLSSYLLELVKFLFFQPSHSFYALPAYLPNFFFLSERYRFLVLYATFLFSLYLYLLPNLSTCICLYSRDAFVLKSLILLRRLPFLKLKLAYECHVVRPLHLYLLPFVDLFFPISPRISRIGRPFLQPGTPTLLLPSGFDPSSTQSCSFEHASFPTTEGALNYVYYGSLQAWKDIETVIAAFSAPFCHPNAHLYLIGPDYDNLLASTLPSNVNYIPTLMPSQLCSLSSSIHAFILPLSLSDYRGRECSPVKLFEYISFGRPIIAVPNSSVLSILGSQYPLYYESSSIHSLIAAMNLSLDSHTLQAASDIISTIDLSPYSWQSRASLIRGLLSQSPI